MITVQVPDNKSVLKCSE